MAMDESIFVTQMHPVDIGEVRDEGVQSLVLLAASLDWNVLKKPNAPVVLTSRDGTQKRLPTDSSCKLSVFQSALSTIMVHTADDLIPTIELMDKIIAKVKPSREHERRLRLSVGESPALHRQRVANDKVAEQKREADEHLTQQPEVPVYLVNEELQDTSALREEPRVSATRVPFDGEEHGELVSREPFRAHYSGAPGKPDGYMYDSVSSFERIWEDGYKDYECQVCGKAYGSPRATGSHRQVHTKAGEVERDMRYVTEGQRNKRNERKSAETVEFVDELPLEEQVAERLAEVAAHVVEVDEADDNYASKTLSQIIELLLPDILAASDAVIAALTVERDEAIKRLAEVEGEFDALVELLTSRKKDR